MRADAPYTGLQGIEQVIWVHKETSTAHDPLQGGLGPTRNGTRVLVVDDDPMSLEVLAVALLEYGFSVRTAASATEALAEARRLPPALVLVDVLMPGIDGFQLCAALKDDPQLSAVPVVLLSADDGGPRDRERGASVGAADYLTKPIDLPGLVRVVRQLAA
ncbi:MAG: response regulator [Chloroflexi bacterium]|nr:response regulator [Chloroflexota bacterium]